MKRNALLSLSHELFFPRLCVAVMVLASLCGSVSPCTAAEVLRMIEGIRVETGVEKKVGVFFKLSGIFLPTCFLLAGKNPRFVCDFGDTRLARDIAVKMDTGSGIVPKIRIGLHREPLKKVRVVLDLDPARDYAIEQIFVWADKEFVLVVESASGEQPAVPGMGVRLQ
jgi:hypothetical protein